MTEIPFEFDLSCASDNDFDLAAVIASTGINLSGYATKAYVNEALDNMRNGGFVIYSSSLINDAGFLKTHQSLSNYYTKSEIDAALRNVSGVVSVTQTLTSGVEIGSINGTKLYAPAGSGGGGGGGSADLSGYATTAYVDQKTDVVQTLSSGVKIGSVGGINLYAPQVSNVCVFG